MRIDRRSLLGGLVAAMVGSSPARGARRAQELPDRVAIMPAATGTLLHTSCIRPPEVAGVWEPDVRSVRAADRRLEAFLARQPSGPIEYVLDRFYRQYVGIVVGGEQVLYVNGFAAWLRQERRELEAPRIDWRSSLLDICDGGYGHFRAQYDLQAGEWSDFRTGGFG